MTAVAMRERPIANTATASEIASARSTIDVRIELNARRLVPGGSILDAPECVESVWGDDHQCIWATGEPLYVVGPVGVGKTTLMQQGALKLIGISVPSLLGFTIHGPRRVLYLACDRPAQARRSFHRMVSDKDRALLDERLVLWLGPLPFDLATEPDALLALARHAGCDVVIIDSLKDVASDLSREEAGQGVNRAFQQCCAEGIEVGCNHHQRKGQQGMGKPRQLPDVYGSRWLTAGAGSVVMLWGDAGDPVVEFTHLKQPDEPVGPFQIVHDHAAGVTTVIEHLDAFAVVIRSTNGVTAADVARAVYGDETRNSREKAKRQLDRLVNEEKIHRQPGARGGSSGSNPDRYHPVSLLRQGGEEGSVPCFTTYKSPGQP